MYLLRNSGFVNLSLFCLYYLEWNVACCNWLVGKHFDMHTYLYRHTKGNRMQNQTNACFQLNPFCRYHLIKIVRIQTYKTIQLHYSWCSVMESNPNPISILDKVCWYNNFSVFLRHGTCYMMSPAIFSNPE